MIIWIASYPKSGNTWIRSLINQILFIDPSNKEKILSSLQKNISAYPKINHFKNLNLTFDKDEDFQQINNIIKNWKTSQDKINTNNNLKFFKTHNILTSINLEGQTYDFTNLENTLGVIYVVRDPRNIITSLKNHFFFNSYDETFEMMIDKKRWIGTSKGRIPEALSSWDQHYNSWSFFPKNYILFKYEELLSDPKKQINRLVKYLQKFIKININENKIDKIISNSKFSNFKNLEKQGLFNEKAIHTETREEKNFFYLGPENDYSKLLDVKTRNKIENCFKKTMVKLNYL